MFISLQICCKVVEIKSFSILWSTSLSVVVFLAAPGSAPTNLTPIPKVNDPKAVNLKWQPPAKPNGQITGKIQLLS